MRYWTNGPDHSYNVLLCSASTFLYIRVCLVFDPQTSNCNLVK